MYRNTWSAANSYVFAVVAAFIKVCFLLLIKTIKQKKTISNQIRIFGQLYIVQLIQKAFLKVEYTLNR